MNPNRRRRTESGTTKSKRASDSTLAARPAGSVPDGERHLSALLDSALDADVDTLRMLLRISQAVMGARHLDEALEIVAEQSRLVLKAASFSISRWERQRGVLRTLINVGELGPDEVRRPREELYPLAEDGLVTDLLRHGRPYVNSIDDHDVDAASVAVIRSLNKESELAVPVIHDGAMWGELWATGTGGRRFGTHDVRLLQAIAAQVSVAIGTAEAFSEVSRYASEDPLTGLANRRALDERLLECFADGSGPTLLVADVDGLKTINDRDGHPAGDALLRGVAGLLSSVASTVPGALVARLGGDEFCVMLPRSSLPDAELLACEATRQISARLGDDVSLCWGAATRDRRTATAHELIAAADAVLLEAKRLGPGRLRIRTDEHATRPVVPSGRRPTRAHPRAIDELTTRVVDTLADNPPPPTVSVLEALACELSTIVGAAAWSLSVTTDDGEAVMAVGGIESRRDQVSGLRLLEPTADVRYRLADYPATAKALADQCAFIAAVDRDDSDPAERKVLRDLGYHAVLVVGCRDAERGYLIEVYTDGPYGQLDDIAAQAVVLMHYCTARGC